LSKYEPKLEPTQRMLEIEANIKLLGKAKAAEKLGITVPTLNSSMQRLESKRRRLEKAKKNGLYGSG